MKKTKKKAKRKNPTDSTMRNVKADNKRDESLKKRVERLEEFVANYFPCDWDHFLKALKPRRGK